MEYIGEHLFPGQLGRFFVSLAFSAAIISAIAYFIFNKTQNAAYKKLARGSFLVHTGSVVGIVLTLFYLLLNHYFEYDYVWKHSSTELPLRYIFSAFWEGQEGSFILWLFWHVVLGCILMFTAKKWEAPAMIVFALVQAFLASMILGIYPLGLKVGISPFVLMRHLPENIGLPWTEVPDYLERFPAFYDGSGLNPLLQNYWMTIHPPTLFLGFASTLVPFAFAMAALFNQDYKGWVKPALPWTFFSVGILGLGILMGGAWAYEALSFGGFWAWDPVENSSLVPWITMVGAAHLMLIFRNKRIGLKAAFFMSILTFILILYSTFLTRSGVLGDASVHSFVDLGMSGQLLIYLFFFIVISFGMLLWRYKKIPAGGQDDNLSSREFWMFIGSLVLLISAFQIIFSTSIPVLNKLFGPDGFLSLLDEEMAPPLDPIEHYNSFQVPFAIVITLLIAIGQFLNYNKTSSRKFWTNISVSLGISLLLTALLAQIYSFWTEAIYLILLFSGLFATISNLYYWLVMGKGRITFSGSSIAHVGFALIMVGALISNARKTIITQSDVFLAEELPSNENKLMDLNDTVQLANYKAVFTGMTQHQDRQYYNVSYFASGPKQANQRLFELQPYLQVTDEMGTTSNPSTKHYWDHDLYTHVTYSSYLVPTTPDGFVDETEVELAQGDTAMYRNHFVIYDSLKVNVGLREDTEEMQHITLTARLRVVNVMGEEFILNPVYHVEMDGNVLTHDDAYMDGPGFKFRFQEINTDNDKILLKAWKKQDEDEKPFIVMKAIVFPLINILWAGSILMVLGTALAVWQRIKAR